MRHRDTTDVWTSAVAVIGDALAVFAGFMLATWIRFDTAIIPFRDLPPPNYYAVYSQAAAIATILFLFIFKVRGLYVRPQIGPFGDKIPRLTHAVGLGIILSVALAFAWRRDPTLSRVTAAISFVTVLASVLIERFILFRWEIHLARHRDSSRRVLILGTDSVAAHLQDAILREPRLRSRVIGFLRTQPADPDGKIAGETVIGAVGDLKKILDEHRVDQVILTDSSIGQIAMIEIILLCEKAMVTFNLVPDLLYVLTGSVDIQTIAGIPLLGVSRWPLDSPWKRMLKRAEDIVGALLGLILASLPMLVIAGLIRRSSPGPVLFRQERCGQNRRVFILYKFRTMEADADNGRVPGWTVKNDPRCTGIGAVLRRNNLDELPQLWNVLKGEMSLVGPRPERPVFVDQFKEDIERYMWRHVCKPGLTGWAQVNGLRGNTDIRERLKHDLYYLENWSLAFDFKILVKTLFARKNAY